MDLDLLEKKTSSKIRISPLGRRFLKKCPGALNIRDKYGMIKGNFAIDQPWLIGLCFDRRNISAEETFVDEIPEIYAAHGLVSTHVCATVYFEPKHKDSKSYRLCFH